LKFKCNLFISCDELFIINQHNFFVFCLECILLQMFMKKLIHCHFASILSSIKSFIHDMWQNIFPRHQVFYFRCDRIYFKYFVNMGRIFLKRFGLVLLLVFMPTSSWNNILLSCTTSWPTPKVDKVCSHCVRAGMM